jgi:hypothetical protein
MPWWGERTFYQVEGKVESITKTRSFFHWFWLKEITKTTFSLSYSENIDKKFENVNENEIKPPKKIYILSNNLSFKTGDCVDLKLGYANPLEQFQQRVCPFIFKFKDGEILWK